MYQLIPAKTHHIPQIISYITSTCYWKEFVEGNTLGQSYMNFMTQWIVAPRVPYTIVLVESAKPDIICGCMINMTTTETATMPDYTPYLHPRVMEVFGAWFNYVLPDSLVSEVIVLDRSIRYQKHGQMMYKALYEKARQQQKIISSFIWAFNHPALITASRYNRCVIDVIKFGAPINANLLVMIEQERRATYFESPEYINTTNMLLSSF